jgi:small GTP-binding protein
MVQKKVCMVGAYAVGKTSLVRRYVESIFDERYQTTVGVKIDKRDIAVEGETVRLVLWDLSGEDDFTRLRLSHLRGASGYILVADGCRRSTFDTARALHERVTEAIGPVPFVVALNKADLKEQWDLEPAPGRNPHPEGWTVFETSAKSGQNVEAMFLHLAREMLRVQEPPRP